MHIVALNERLSIVKPPASQRLRSGFVVLQPGERVGQHSTNTNEELLVIITGTAQVTAGEEITSITGPMAVFLPQNTIHDVENVGKGELRYVYVVA